MTKRINVNVEKTVQNVGVERLFQLRVLDQLTNNEYASDAELIQHLAKETGNSIPNISKLVKAERNNFMNKFMNQDKAIRIVKKYIKTGWE